MRAWHRWLAPLAGALLAAGCGGGGGDSGGGNPAPSTPPTVTITASPTSVDAGGSSTLTWSSTNATGCTASLGWSGAKATSGSESTGPLQQSGSFRLSCTGAGGTTAAQVDITVNAAGAHRTVRGIVTYGHVPHGTTLGNGLDYAAQSQRPARAITVEAVGADSGTVLASTSTDDEGRYELRVDAGTSLRIRARAEMLRAASLPAPRWNVRVSDADGAATVYTYSGPVVAGGAADVVHDLPIPSGWDSAGNPAGTRDAAPFSILDAVYEAMRYILLVDANATFPALELDWSPSNTGGDTFYAGGSTPTITVAGQANADTDEYDRHVIVHEYAHYLEDQFGRSDSIGGPHAFGDILDPRVAFGEGYAYAFAALALEDPLVRDTLGTDQARESYFNVETNTSTNAGWFSESSVQEALYDFVDEGAEANDTLSLPFATVWGALTGAQRATPAFTTIYPLVTALRAAAPGSVGAIDARLSAESIGVSSLDDYGSGETNIPLVGAPSASDALPVHAIATIGGPVVLVRSTNKWGTFNALSNSRFVRFSVGSARNITITATSAVAGRDVDFLLFQNGALRVVAEDSGTAAETRTVNLGAGNYVLEVYDCGNAECGNQTPQPVDINVTLQ